MRLMQEQKAASTLQWYVMAADSAKNGQRRQPERPSAGERKVNCGLFTHPPQDSSLVTKNLNSLVHAITSKPQQHKLNS